MTPMTAPRAIALVSADAQARAPLARYLEQAGFEVREQDAVVGRPPPVLVWLSERDAAAEDVHGQVLAWLGDGEAGAAGAERVIVVTSRPTALKDLVASHERRLVVLAAPVFGWQIVDALRAG